MQTEREKLAIVHRLRMEAHWGKRFDAFAPGLWPQNDAEWRQADHGASWDTNIHMARWHLALAEKIVSHMSQFDAAQRTESRISAAEGGA